VFHEGVVTDFFGALRSRYAGPAVVEPRHHTWFTPGVDTLLRDHGIGRVAADPARWPEAAEPGGDMGVVYYRWHGSPRMYYSDYPPDALAALARRLSAHPEADEVWCIFDNTTVGYATGNALTMQGRFSPAPPGPAPRA
jgi:uncharacterized protein YecE (DUF72 family)